MKTDNLDVGKTKLCSSCLEDYIYKLLTQEHKIADDFRVHSERIT